MPCSFLNRFDTLIFIGARKPVTFFGYEGIPSVLVSEAQEAFTLASVEADIVGALTALADELGAASDACELCKPCDTARQSNRRTQCYQRWLRQLSVYNLKMRLSLMKAFQPLGRLHPDMAHAAPAHTYLRITGGAIGFGMPASVGAAVACPDRPVINIQADGSAMYTVQALWTQARESLNITTLICNNNRYDILQTELRRGADSTLRGNTRRV